MKDYPIYLKHLESEAIFILREAFAAFKTPVLMYSIGKDSSVLLHLAKKAFYPEKIPFSVLHIDTGWKFKEMIEHRDQIAKCMPLDLIIYKNQDGTNNNITPFNQAPDVYTRIMKTEALRKCLEEYEFDAAIGGARRDEEKSRAKERVFSIRHLHTWDPRRQRPEFWSNYNTLSRGEQTFRVFPLSNWTELDVWNYIHIEEIPVVSLYFSKLRPVVERNGKFIMVDDNRFIFEENENLLYKQVRFRTLGCYPLTAAIESCAANVYEVIKEISSSQYSERQGRLIDYDQHSSMESKKKEGYF